MIALTIGTAIRSAAGNGLGALLSVLNAKIAVAALNGTHRTLAALVRGPREKT